MQFCCVFIFFIIIIGVELLYNVLVSDVQQSESAIVISTLLESLFPRLLHSIE